MNKYHYDKADDETMERCEKAAMAHGVKVMTGEESVVMLVTLVENQDLSGGDVICAWRPESARNVAMALLKAADLLDPPARA